MVLQQMYSHTHYNEGRYVLHFFKKQPFKVDLRQKYVMQNSDLLEDNIGENPSNLAFRCITKCTLHEIFKLDLSEVENVSAKDEFAKGTSCTLGKNI